MEAAPQDAQPGQTVNSNQIILSEFVFPIESDGVLLREYLAGQKLREKAEAISAQREESILKKITAPEVVTPVVEKEVTLESYYFINGIQTILVEQKLETRWVSETFNRKYTLISNDEQNIIIDVTKSVGGLISNRIGCYLEKDETDELKSKVIDDLLQSKSVNFAAHSQGAIIVYNVLGEIKRQQGDRWWDQHANQISVRYFGNSIRDWPPGIKVTGYLQEGDNVAKIAAKISGCSTWLKSSLGREYQQATIIIIPGDKHDFHSYIKSQPAFYVQDFMERNGGKLNGGLLAEDLFESIKNSNVYGPDAYTEVVDYCVKVGGKEFCVSIKPYLREEGDSVYIENIRIGAKSALTIHSESAE